MVKRKQPLRLLTLAAIGAGLFALGWGASSLHGQAQMRSRLTSRVVSWDDAKSHTDHWGEMRTYFTGETYGTTNLLVAVAVVKPGEAVHPAHRHSEEEFLALVDGTGEWRLNGKPFAAKKGDILYVQPWDFHGLMNTGTEPLTFLVVRWNNQAVNPPPAPAGDNGR